MLPDANIKINQAVGALDLGIGNTVDLSQVVECITILNNVDDPGVGAPHARDRGFGGKVGR